MAKDFQDIQQLDSEECDHQLGRNEGPGARGQNPRTEDPFWKGPRPPQPVLQQLCSRRPLGLLALGFNVLLLVAICVIGSQSEGHRGTQLQVELRALKETFSNFSLNTLSEVQALSTHGGSTGDKITSLGAKLKKQQQDLKADHASLLLHLKHFPVDLRALACWMAFFQSNGTTECCPVNWVEHRGSCYWFSRTGKTWPEAEKYCQLENANLVVINSWEEQKFIIEHTRPFATWIGLTDSDGTWKWVDGTDYRYGYRTWGFPRPGYWRGYEVGRSESCAEVEWNGRWNNIACQELHRWVCEMTQNITG
ncbi:PREDICTED: asialoglycoprotein receptor 2 isoform X1 [Galeopterus variegatus]|uniref:Asialoglycoprotein receptor 2 isoform X1 n=1 Tax=Galeopterus variegatus TaxID=482537 RepID=A0ABM0S5N1_GALVR|nr:PREDICTED: asialoglycoprotein receptor 2 isoform X1 [Galeopterus variegatus]